MNFARLLSNTPLALGFLVSLVLLAAAAGAPGKTEAGADLVVADLTDGLTPQSLADGLAGPGVTISNVQYGGAAEAAGSFTGGGDIIGFETGVILSTGRAKDVAGPNDDPATQTINGTPGDPQLTELAGFPTFDAAILEFDFVPTGGNVAFRFVFASEEYNEFVGSPFNDVFAFFINGVDCALVPGTNTPITVNTINNGQPGQPPANPQHYINNDPFNADSTGDTVPPASLRDTEMDGLTRVLSCFANVNAGVTNHMKLAIADASDEIYDSVVFLEIGSLVGTGPGDVDCNGLINAVDALFVLRRVAALQPYAECISRGDVNCNGTFDSVDALIILRFVALLPPLSVPPGCPPVGSG
jgi:hypothetical protein